MSRARPLQTLLAALATLIAAWPASTLFVGYAWVPGTSALVALVAATGLVGRYFDLSPLLTLSGQLFGVVAAVLIGHLGDHLDSTLPAALQALGSDAHHTVISYAAPAPTTIGIIFFIQLIIAVIAISVDFLAVTGRSPAVAGLPLLVAFVISAANSGGALHPKYFLALGVVWLAMLYAASERLASDWSGLRAHSSGRSSPSVTLGGHDFGQFTRVAGVAALVLAVVAAGVLPASSQRFVTNGLARGANGSSNVGFSSTLDLTKNLNDQDKTPVLTFHTKDPSPPPLRALVSDTYSDGNWVQSKPRELMRGTDDQRLRREENPAPLNADSFQLTVSNSAMRPPYVVAPTQVRSADFGSRTWNYDPGSGQPSAPSPISGYGVDYLVPRATARPTTEQDAAAPAPDTFLADLAVDEASKPQIATFVRQAAPRGTPFARAVDIQDYLRNGGGFVYSLTLARTRKTSAGAPLDPISNFLVTKQGYCVQFTSAMVMAARSIGIPARVGVGFLPGTSTASGVYEVKQSDAHAWPELYFPGMGWTRFEPTSGSRSGAAPAYATPKVNTSTAPAPSRQATPPKRAIPSAPRSITASKPVMATGTGRALPLGWLLWTLLVLALITAAFCVLPVLGRRSRRRLAETRDTGGGDRVQAQWEDLVARMADLGIDPAPPVSPKAQEQYYSRRLSIDRQGRESLHTAVVVLERSRYTDRPGDDISATADDLIARIRETRTRRRRVTATLFPQAGRDALRSLLTRR
ncbi:MAG: DUF3488 and transglutaminase-like domain-containing protein [Allobranchiibius sp.]